MLDHKSGLPAFTADGGDELRFVQAVSQDPGPLPTTLLGASAA